MKQGFFLVVCSDQYAVFKYKDDIPVLKLYCKNKLLHALNMMTQLQINTKK